MNYEQAVRLLDQTKDGQTFPIAAINLALEITGDIDETTTKHDSQYAQSSFQEVFQVSRNARAGRWC